MMIWITTTIPTTCSRSTTSSSSWTGSDRTITWKEPSLVVYCQLKCKEMFMLSSITSAKRTNPIGLKERQIPGFSMSRLSLMLLAKSLRTSQLCFINATRYRSQPRDIGTRDLPSSVILKTLNRASSRTYWATLCRSLTLENECSSP